MNVLIRDQDLFEEHLFFAQWTGVDGNAAVANNRRHRQLATPCALGYLGTLLAGPRV